MIAAATLIIAPVATAIVFLPVIILPAELQLPEPDRANAGQVHIVVAATHILARLVIQDLLMEILPVPVTVAASLVGIVQPVAPVIIKIFVRVQQLQIVTRLRPPVAILVQQELIM
jgi:hypothetical protein